MSIATRPLLADFGAEILHIDLSAETSDAVFSEILQIYYEKSVVLFRDQALSPESQAKLAHRFGNPKIENRKQYNLRSYPEVSTIGNVKDDEGTPLSFFVKGGFGWHTDGTAACHVDAATFLYAVEVPKSGGDTLLCSTANVIDRLPADLLQKLESLSILCSFHAHNDPLHESDPEAFISLTEEERKALPPVWHKVVQVHPVTGRKLLYMSFDPLDCEPGDLADAKQLLIEARNIATIDEQVYRHLWRPGDLLIWDNHAALHSGTPTHMYEEDTRLMHRSFVYTLPTEREIPNLDELNRIFMP
jgi:taurine dioxygenase